MIKKLNSIIKVYDYNYPDKVSRDIKLKTGIFTSTTNDFSCAIQANIGTVKYLIYRDLLNFIEKHNFL